MTLVYFLLAISLVTAGVVIGVICVVCLGIHREERDRSMTGDATIPVIRGVRRLTGLSARGYGCGRESIRHGYELRQLQRPHGRR